MFAVTEAANTELATDGVSKYLPSRDMVPERPVGSGEGNRTLKASSARWGGDRGDSSASPHS